MSLTETEKKKRTTPLWATVSSSLAAGVLGILLGTGSGGAQNNQLNEQVATLHEQVVGAEAETSDARSQLAAAQKRNSDENTRLTTQLAEANERVTVAEAQVAEHTRVAEAAAAVDAAAAAEAAAAAQAPRALAQAPPANVHYANCAAARAAGAAPVRAGQPGYGTHLDRDGDGIGCE